MSRLAADLSDNKNVMWMRKMVTRRYATLTSIEKMKGAQIQGYRNGCEGQNGNRTSKGIAANKKSKNQKTGIKMSHAAWKRRWIPKRIQLDLYAM
jgi:hypothetical protein